MKGIVKANTVDKYLKPIRQQIVELIEPNVTVLEIGCGNGDLLFKLTDKIQKGIGLDKSEQLISYASRRKEEEKIENLIFKVKDVISEPITASKSDYSITSLLFHILQWNEAKELLNKQLTLSETTIVCGFSKPKNWRQALLLWFDQRFTPHYSNYKKFKKEGFTEGLLNSVKSINYTRLDTFDSVIKIYIVTRDQV